MNHLLSEQWIYIGSAPRQAPVSALNLFGRSQDLDYEIEVGNSPRQSPHLRLWQSVFQRPNALIWFAAATLDVSVGWRRLTHRVDRKID